MSKPGILNFFKHVAQQTNTGSASPAHRLYNISIAITVAHARSRNKNNFQLHNVPYNQR